MSIVVLPRPLRSHLMSVLQGCVVHKRTKAASLCCPNLPQLPTVQLKLQIPFESVGVDHRGLFAFLRRKGKDIYLPGHVRDHPGHALRRFASLTASGFLMIMRCLVAKNDDVVRQSLHLFSDIFLPRRSTT